MITKRTNTLHTEPNITHTTTEYLPNSKDFSVVDQNVVKNTIANLQITDSNHIQLPIVWNERTKHLIAENRRLAFSLLKSQIPKFKREPETLELLHETFMEQKNAGYIHKVYNLNNLSKRHKIKPTFLAHMPVLRMDHQSTKCRPVFLSNTAEKPYTATPTLTHNKSMLPGPNLNQKITTSLMQLRFDKYILTYDIKKAFNSIKIPMKDSLKLLFYWYKDPLNGNFEPEIYMTDRVPFGLVCSPFLLMISLYYILVMDTKSDTQPLKLFKRSLYSHLYMDNGGITSNSQKSLDKFVEWIPEILHPYNFFTQQYNTNSRKVLDKIRALNLESESTRILGITYNSREDTLITNEEKLDPNANSKRQVLSTVHSIYDPHGFIAPYLVRAKLFLQSLLTDQTLTWDSPLSKDRLKEWAKIVKQFNGHKNIAIPRSVGSRDENYRLVAFTDASKHLFATVIYIQSLDSGKIAFLISRNKVAGAAYGIRTIPDLELLGIKLGMETLIDTKNQLETVDIHPRIKIKHLKLFTDSTICIDRLKSYVHNFDKINKKKSFVINQLEAITKLCEIFPCRFLHVKGLQNPADKITKPSGELALSRSNFYSGTPLIQGLADLKDKTLESLLVPNPHARKSCDIPTVNMGITSYQKEKVIRSEDIFDTGKHTFTKNVRILRYCLRFINSMVRKIKQQNEDFPDLKHNFENPQKTAQDILLRNEQQRHYPEIFDFFERDNTPNSQIPVLCRKYNIILNENGALSIKAKLREGSNPYPIFLPPKSKITREIILDMHNKYSHIRSYQLVALLKKSYYLQRPLQVINNTLKDCVTCKRYTGRTIKLNQNEYAEFRQMPEKVPFKDIFIDHIGPYLTKFQNVEIKTYVLAITCLYSRAVNLVMSVDLSTTEYLKALNKHIFSYGCPSTIRSDQGTQLIAGAKTLQQLFEDETSKQFFEERNIKWKNWQYPTGRHQLGGLIENIVLQARRLINAAIGRKKVDTLDFQLVIAQTVALLNKRPISFKDSLRSEEDLELHITPEMLLHGRELPMVNFFLNQDEEDPAYKDQDVFADKKKLVNSMTKLKNMYDSQFLENLYVQSTNKDNFYVPQTHTPLEVGDIVLIKQDLFKAVDYPLAIVMERTMNDLGEITSVKLKKGHSGKIVHSHVSKLIPYLKRTEATHQDVQAEPIPNVEEQEPPRRYPRRASRQRVNYEET